LNFPLFVGDKPKLLLHRSKDYFELYDVPHDSWIRVAVMHCDEAAGRWLQSVESKLSSCSWSQISQMVLGHFGRDQHELLIRQLIALRQTDCLSSYIDQLFAIYDQLAAYQRVVNPLYFTIHFIEGLHSGSCTYAVPTRSRYYYCSCPITG